MLNFIRNGWLNLTGLSTLTAQEINDPAVYNWYDSDGNLIYSGNDLTVSPDMTQDYQLEVIKDSDGFKDYDEVNVSVNPFVLGNINPNPATDTIDVEYIADQANSAQLIMTEIYTYITHEHNLDTTQTNKTIDILNYSSGIYFVTLVCDGANIATKTLIIN